MTLTPAALERAAQALAEACNGGRWHTLHTNTARPVDAARARDRREVMPERPAPYRPAEKHVPWWWTWGGIWKDGTRYATWPQARKVRQRASKKGRTP